LVSSFQLPAIVNRITLIAGPGASLLLALLLVVVVSCPLPAQQPPPGAVTAESLLVSLEAAVESEKAEAAALVAERDRLNHLKTLVLAEISAYKIQQNTYQHLLLIPQASLADIRQAALANDQALTAIGNRLTELGEKIRDIETAIAKTQQKATLYRQQANELRSVAPARDQAAEALKILSPLIQLLNDRQKDLKAALDLVRALVPPFEAAQSACNELAAKLADRIASQQRQQLFQRQWVALSPQGIQQIVSEMTRLRDAVSAMATPAYWQAMVQALQAAGGLTVLAFWALLGAVLSLFKRIKRTGRQRELDPAMDQTPWRRLGLKMINRSLLLAGAWAVVTGFAKIQPRSPILAWTATAADILAVFVLSNWALVFCKHAVLFGKRVMDGVEGLRVRRLLMGLRLGAIFYLLLDRFFDGTGTLLSLVRLVLEAALALWCLHFFSRYRDRTVRDDTGQPPWARAASWLCHIIVLGGFLIELAGYGFLARHWYWSWALCLAVSLWGAVGFMVLQEWQNRIRADVRPDAAVNPVHWLLVQGCWLAFWVGLILAQIQAWASGTRLWVDLLDLSRTPLAIGNISISLAGLTFALLILVVTYTVSQLARQLLKEKLLDGSGLEPGFQDSLVTMSRYLLWILGAVMALNVLGVSSTSMAVVFGALSVGLGFGLQNIFNNFVSGIILLFERSIQVGDTVEINGTWAVVKKINVRATVVQTYDNASLIIPNAEFISSQVTNWTHKDMRLRRTVTIGVAYGSDVEQVRQVLQQIAASIPQILTEPAPQVLFDDFGDSALIFKLRFWTHLEGLPKTETEVRFEINRRFKDLGIEIPFPQRDVHIRS